MLSAPSPSFHHPAPPKRTQPVERRDAPAISAARNPCPCAYYGNPKRDCRCAPRQIEIYRQRISGPLLDRIDLHVEVPLVAYKDLASATSGEKSERIRQRVTSTRARQQDRFVGNHEVCTNSSMSAREVRLHCELDRESSSFLEQAMAQLNFSARAHDRILKVARTLADLDGATRTGRIHVAEAISYRIAGERLASAA